MADCGFSIYEHLEPSDITEQYFKEYNTAKVANVQVKAEAIELNAKATAKQRELKATTDAAQVEHILFPKGLEI